MKKFIFLMGVILAVGLFLHTAKSAEAAKTADTCASIKDGTIMDKFNQTIELGYNALGYNYEAHMFNGLYCDAYGDADWCQQFKDVNLMMKWNDAWLSNKDCGTQGPDQGAYSSIDHPDNVLDRHYSSDSYIDSGAWLTNHATGTYISSNKTDWNVTGTFTMVHHYLGVDYPHDLIVTDTNGVLTGNGGYPAGGPYQYAWTITSGSVSGDTIDFYADYTLGAVGTTMHAFGTIAPDGSMSGIWTDNYGGPREGTWSTTGSTVATAVPRTCTVSDFVKIVAVPATAFKDPLVPDLYGEGMWYTDSSKTTEIGPVLWGNFAVIQEMASDPCGEYGIIDYMSPLKKGLGKW